MAQLMRNAASQGLQAGAVELNIDCKLRRKQGTNLYAALRSPARRFCYPPKRQPQLPRATAQGREPQNVERNARVLQSLVETGIRGSLAVCVAWTAHYNALSLMHWDSKDALVGVFMALPIVMADAVLMRPDHSPNKMLADVLAAHQTDANSSALAASLQNISDSLQWQTALSKAQFATQQQQRHWNMDPLPLALGLEALGQVSEDVLARGVLLVLAGHWLADRLFEAGMDDTITLLQQPHVVSMELTTYTQWIALATIASMLAVRYVREARSFGAPSVPAPHPHALGAPVGSDTHPQATATQLAQAVAEDGAVPPMSDSARRVEQLSLALSGMRFVAGQVTLYSAFVLTGNLVASFAGGMLIQVSLIAMCRARSSR